MTLPFERRNAIVNTEQFLLDLLDTNKTPRISKEIRKRAAQLLKHYPTAYHMEEVRHLAPKIFGEWDSEFKENE